jgi:hypothetical protein
MSGCVREGVGGGGLSPRAPCLTPHTHKQHTHTRPQDAPNHNAWPHLCWRVGRGRGRRAQGNETPGVPRSYLHLALPLQGNGVPKGQERRPVGDNQPLACIAHHTHGTRARVCWAAWLTDSSNANTHSHTYALEHPSRPPVPACPPNAPPRNTRRRTVEANAPALAVVGAEGDVAAQAQRWPVVQERPSGLPRDLHKRVVDLVGGGGSTREEGGGRWCRWREG